MIFCLFFPMSVMMLVTFLFFGIPFYDQSLTVNILVFSNEWYTFEPCQVKELMLILWSHNLSLSDLLDLGLDYCLFLQCVLLVMVDYSKLLYDESSPLVLKIVCNSIMSVLSLRHYFGFSEVFIVLVSLSFDVNFTDSAQLNVSCCHRDIQDVLWSWITRQWLYYSASLWIEHVQMNSLEVMWRTFFNA